MRCRNAFAVALLIALWPSAVAAQQSVTRIPGALRFLVNSQTVADNGGGTAASGTVTVGGYSYVALTCSDANGCTMSVSESGAQSGQILWIVNVSANTATFADSAGVLELADGTSFAAAQYEALLLQYVSDRWIEVGRTGAVAGGGGGSVTSVGLSAPALFSVSGSPVTTSGTLALSFASQSANTFLAGPTTGSAAAPTMRTMALADLPVCASTKIYKSDGSAMVCDDDAGASSGAPAAAQYVTLATDATLSNERVLTAGDSITLTDAGAGSTLTVKVTPTADDQVYVGNGTVMQATTVPDCDNATTSKLLYDQATNAFSCGTDQTGGGGGGDSTTTDTEANKPAASNDGNLFFPNNGFYVWRDTGAAWAPWGPIFPMTAPSTSGFAWENGTATTVTTTQGGIHFDLSTSGSGTSAYLKTAPATPYTITAAYLTGIRPGSANNGFGPCFRESSSGEIIALYTLADGNLQVWRWNNTGSFNTVSLTHTGAAHVGLVWVQAIDNGTNLQFKVGPDGQHWVTFFSESRTAFMAGGPDQVGTCLITNTQFATSVTLLSWKEGS